MLLTGGCLAAAPRWSFVGNVLVEQWELLEF
jgi:hypothetical protein